MFRSIRWRLVLSYVFLILLTVGVIGSVVLQLVEDRAERQEIEHLTTNAQAVAQQAAPLLWPFPQPPALQELAETSSFLSDARVRVLGVGREVLADSSQAGNDRAVWFLLPQELKVVIPDGGLDPFVLGLPSGGQVTVPSSWHAQFLVVEHLPAEAGMAVLSRHRDGWRGGFEYHVIQDPAQFEELVGRAAASPRSGQAVAAPIGDPAAPLGYVQVSDGPDFVTEALETTRQTFFYAAAGAVLLAVVVGLLVSRGLAAPLLKLADIAGQMSAGDLSIRAPVRGRDEIGRLAGQFNHMAERLETSFADLASERDALRRFIADASHELRTPITALRSFNDLLQGAAADDPAARAEFLAESQAQIDRLEWVTLHLLDLSRLDAGLVALDLDEHDVGDLIESASSAFGPLAREKGISLLIRPPMPALQLVCDRARVELALSNLLDNAVKFVPPGGQVEVGARQVGEAIHLWVRDDGPGIHPEDLPHIFDRFYRGREAAVPGSGLGLAIVQSVVQAHGGQVSVESEPGAGSLFVVKLPLVA